MAARTSGRRRLGAGVALATVGACAGLSIGAQGAGAAVSCGKDEFGQVVVTLREHHDLVTLRRGADGAIVYDPARPSGADPGPATACSDATVFNTDLVTFVGDVGTAQGVRIDLTGGPFAPGADDEPGASDEIEFIVELRGGTRYEPDLVRVHGAGSDDSFVLGGDAVNLNAREAASERDGDVRFATPKPGSLELFGGGGSDTLSANGGSGTGGKPAYNWLRLYGGSGIDALTGAGISGGSYAHPDNCAGRLAFTFAVTEDRRFECLYGGTGDDIVGALAGNDVVIGGPGADVLNGHSGRDRLMGSSGRDRLLGGEGRDRLDGGLDPDLCNGGSGDDSFRSCEERR